MAEDAKIDELRLEIERLRREVAELRDANEAPPLSHNDADERIRFQNAMLATQMETSPDAILIVDEDSELVSFNQHFIDLWHMPNDVVETKSAVAVLTKAMEMVADPEGFLARVTYLYAHPKEKSHEEIAFRDGRTLERHSSSMFGDDGRYYGRVWYFRDITEQKRAARALQSSEEQHRTTLDSMVDAIHVINNEHKVVLANKTLAKWLAKLGLEKEPLGKTVFELFPFLPPCVRDEYDNVFTSGKPMHTTEEIALGDQKVYASVLKIPVVNDAVVERVVTVIRDTTVEREDAEERRKLEAQMLATQKLESLGLVAGGIAHDFNNLLVAVLGYADLAKMSLPAESAASAHLDQIVIAANHLAELTKQMLAYAGKRVMSSEIIHLSCLVQEMSDLLRVTTPKNVTIEYRCADDLPAVKGDSTQLRQVVLNLMTNASEAFEDTPGNLTVVTRVEDVSASFLSETVVDDGLEPGRYVVLEVSDTGHGMSEETATKIFDPFFTTKFTGRGLGLASVLGIVRGHNGAIKVDTQLGKGTTIQVLFPCEEQLESEDGGDDSVSKVFSRKHTVLVVDDESYVRSVAEQMLRLAGYRVLTAASGSECLTQVEKHGDDVNLVLLDVTMPGMSGRETFDELHRKHPKIHVLLFSGHEEKGIANQFESATTAGFVQKPFDYVTLISKVRQVLR